MATSKLKALWNHPAGPKTIHFWAPTFKWGISIANLADSSKPPEKVSYPQQIAVTATGVIWSRYSTVITPAQAFTSLLGKSGTTTSARRKLLLPRNDNGNHLTSYSPLAILCLIVIGHGLLVYSRRGLFHSLSRH